ncbi:MAG: hypothetical protein N2442_05405, partial [Spirochaetes bacterium]|nr:hypothetical protein [Spirochaetota bacterium]
MKRGGILAVLGFGCVLFLSYFSMQGCNLHSGEESSTGTGNLRIEFSSALSAKLIAPEVSMEIASYKVCLLYTSDAADERAS